MIYKIENMYIIYIYRLCIYQNASWLPWMANAMKSNWGLCADRMAAKARTRALTALTLTCTKAALAPGNVFLNNRNEDLPELDWCISGIYFASPIITVFASC